MLEHRNVDGGVLLTLFVPAEIASQAPRIKRFFDAILYKLRKNAHKPSFEEASVPECVRLLKQEVDELERAILEGNTIEVVLESADVASYAMIASVAAVERMS